MSDLKQRLERLATQAPSATPPDGLWRHGVRRRRQRLAARVAGAAAAAVVVGGLAGVTVHSIDAAPAPAAPPGGLGAIPTRVDAASPWLPAADASSPIGPLAVVLGAERKGLLGASSNGLVGISARTGTYRSLDLPGRVSGDNGWGDSTEVALSPDGRWVAYWLGGSDPDSTVVGAAAYDTRTGAVRRLPLASRVASRYGVAQESLSWADDDRLLVNWAEVTSVGAEPSARVQPSVLWTPGGQVRELPWRLTGFSGLRPAPGGLSASAAGVLELLDSDLRSSGRHRLPLGTDQALDGDVVVSADRFVALVVSDSDLGRSQLLTGRLPSKPRARVDLRAVDIDRLSPERVLAGEDARHLLVLGHVGATRGVYSVDVVTGRSRPVVAVPDQVWRPGIEFASDLWDRAPVARPGAPWTPDPRWVAVAVGAAVLLGSTWWRRRRDVV